MLIGLFGITGNPPHLGHLTAIDEAAKIVDEVWVSPVYQHPFGKQPLAYNIRVMMTQLLLENSNSNNVKLIEADKDYFLHFNKVPYSYDLLKWLSKQYPEHKFKLVIGEDNKKPEIWQKFYKYNEIDNEFGTCVLPDLGTHSTKIREALKNNIIIDNALPENITKYILTNNLYSEA